MTELEAALATRQMVLMEELAEARKVAREYYHDVEQLAGDYQWKKHWEGDVEDYPWLKATDAD